MNIEVIGIDHIYVSVTDLARSEAFYDRIMPVLGFLKNSFRNEGDRHIQYYNRHFGFVLRPAKRKIPHDPLTSEDTAVPRKAIWGQLQEASGQ